MHWPSVRFFKCKAGLKIERRRAGRWQAEFGFHVAHTGAAFRKTPQGFSASRRAIRSDFIALPLSNQIKLWPYNHILLYSHHANSICRYCSVIDSLRRLLLLCPACFHPHTTTRQTRKRSPEITAKMFP